MKIAKETGAGHINVIRAYSPGAVSVNQTLLERSFILASDTLLPDWPPQSVEEITLAHLESALALEPEVLLIGTGALQRFPAAELLANIIGRGIGVEIMDTAAACRTYNILLNEDRRVVAALLMI